MTNFVFGHLEFRERAVTCLLLATMSTSLSICLSNRQTHRSPLPFDHPSHNHAFSRRLSPRLPRHLPSVSLTRSAFPADLLASGLNLDGTINNPFLLSNSNRPTNTETAANSPSLRQTRSVGCSSAFQTRCKVFCVLEASPRSRN